MSRKNSPEQFREDAVDLYESTPGATVRGGCSGAWSGPQHVSWLARRVGSWPHDRRRRYDRVESAAGPWHQFCVDLEEALRPSSNG